MSQDRDKLLETVKEVGDWLRSTGYSEDVSPVCTGLYDLYEGVLRIHRELIPKLLSLDGENPVDYKKAGNVLMDLIFEFEHLGNHCISAHDSLRPAYDHVEMLEEEFDV